MAEGGEGGEDEIQFLRTVSLRGGARRWAGGEERGPRRCGAWCPARSSHPWAAEADQPHTRVDSRGCVTTGSFSCLSLLYLPPSPAQTSTFTSNRCPGNLLLDLKPLMPKLPARFGSWLP